MKRGWLIVIIILICHQKFWAQQVFTEVRAKLDVQEIDNFLSITGTVENLKPEYKSIAFKLNVNRTNARGGNISNNAQEGRETLDPLSKIVLSKTQVNKSEGDKIILLLLIYDENKKIIGKDRIVIGGVDETKVEVIRPKDGLEMVGIISNDTKTKLGNDFYDLFYNDFAKLNIKSKKIVTVQEELTFGRTTKIFVQVDGEVIDEFIARPDEDFLKYMSQAFTLKVFQYFKNLEKQSKSIIQY